MPNRGAGGKLNRTTISPQKITKGTTWRNQVLEQGEIRNIEATTNYILQSILETNALLFDGYPENLMPPIGAILTEAQIESLVTYIVKASKNPLIVTTSFDPT